MDWILLVAMAALLVFMFWSSRRRAARMKAEQEAKSRAMLPGVKVLLQGGLYGTLVEYDGEDLSKSARVELAPGVEVEVHSQAILRVVDEEEGTVTEDEFIQALEVLPPLQWLFLPPLRWSFPPLRWLPFHHRMPAIQYSWPSP